MTHVKSVDFLVRADYTSRDPALPSWVPDLSRATVKGFLTRTYAEFATAGNTSASIQIRSESELILRGRFVDTISHIDVVAEPLGFSRGISNKREAHCLYDYLLRIETMAKSSESGSPSIRDNERHMHAVWRTAAMECHRRCPIG